MRRGVNRHNYPKTSPEIRKISLAYRGYIPVKIKKEIRLQYKERVSKNNGVQNTNPIAYEGIMVLFPLKANLLHFTCKLAVLILTLLAFIPPSRAEVRARDNLAFIEIRVQNNLISVDLIEARLEDVLHSIGKKAGFKSHLSGDLSERLTITFIDVPLEKGLKRLAGKHSLSFLYRQAQTSTPTSQDGTKDIAEIWVISRTGNAATNRTVPYQPGESPENTDEIPSSQTEPLPQPSSIAEEENDSAVLQQAIDDLVARGDEAAVMAAAAFLRHENEEFRRMAIEGLSTVQGNRSTQVLGRVLLDEPEAEIRMMALRALADRQADPEAQAVISQALDDPDQEIQTLADQLLSQ